MLCFENADIADKIDFNFYPKTYASFTVIRDFFRLCRSDVSHHVFAWTEDVIGQQVEEDIDVVLR